MSRYFCPILFLLFPVLLSAQTDAERAMKLIEIGRFAEAKPITDRLLQQSTTLSDASALTDIGIAFEDAGRYVEAEPFFKRALDINKRQHGENHPDTVPALTNLAINYKERGRYAEAEPLYKQALAIVPANDFQAALLKNNLGFLYQEQFREEEAEKLYQEALDIHKTRTSGKDDEYMASPLQNLSRLYYFQSRRLEAESSEKRNLLREAEVLAKRALTIDEKTDPDDSQTGASLNMLGAVYSDQQRFAEAEPLLKRALSIYQKGLSKHHPWYAECMHDLATLYERQKRYADAEPFRNHTIDVYLQSGAEAHLGQDWYNSRATLYKETNRPDKAVADLKRAMDLSLEVRRWASGSDEQRAQTFSRYYDLFERMVIWQHELGDMNEAYEAMERSRAQGLQDLMVASGIDFLAGVPPETAKRLRDAESVARAAVASYEKQIANLPPQHNMTNVQRTESEKLTRDLQLARKRLSEASAAIRWASPAYRLMIGEDRKPEAFEAVQKELDVTKTLALQYFVGKEKSFVLVYGYNVEPMLLPLELNSGQAKLFRVDAGPLTSEKLVEILHNSEHDGALQIVANNVSFEGSDISDKLAVLWHLLVPNEAIRSNLTDGRNFAKLLILPDGVLSRLPFEMLIVEKDVFASAHKYLLDDGPPIVYAPSASMYYNLSHRIIETTTRRILTVGNPDYEFKRTEKPSDVSAARHHTQRSTRFGWHEPLTWTQSETEWIEMSAKANNIDVTRFNQLQATEENIRKNMSGREIVHLACHGLAEVDQGSAMFSALAVTIGDPNDSKNDGYLELWEMFDIPLSGCELAVLSACNTNIGPDQHGEGTWSMGRGMLASGARRVVTTNWLVDDEPSAHLVRRFISLVNQSSEPNCAEALHRAKRSIRGDRDERKLSHPYYWASFVLIGPD